MIIYDSNVWVAYFNKRDNQHFKARHLVGSVQKQEAIGITEYVLGETCSVLLFNAGREIVNVFIEEIFCNKEVEVLYSDKEFFNQTVALFQNSKDDKLSFIDTSLLFWSRFYEVVTFDWVLANAIKKLN